MHFNPVAILSSIQLLVLSNQSSVEAKNRMGRPKLGKWLTEQTRDNGQRRHRNAKRKVYPSLVGDEEQIGHELAFEVLRLTNKK